MECRIAVKETLQICIWGVYSGGDKTSVKTFKTLKAYISHNKAKNPNYLGAKWKLLFSSFQKWSWMLVLLQYWLSYGLEKVQNLKFVWPKLRGKWLKPPKNEGLCFEIKIWICCQNHEFYHILMINGSFGKLRTWGIYFQDYFIEKEQC